MKRTEPVLLRRMASVYHLNGPSRAAQATNRKKPESQKWSSYPLAYWLPTKIGNELSLHRVLVAIIDD